MNLHSGKIRFYFTYQSILMAAALLFLTALPSCSSHKKTVRDNDRHHHTSIINGKKLSKWEKLIVEEAYTWMGTPYKYAGQEKGIGTDCSGMVMEVYHTVDGRLLPRNSAKQAEFCIPLNRDEVGIGDLVFFATGKDPERISHVGIMLDDESFIHASSSKGVVVSRVDAPYYVRTFKMYGRVP